MRIYDDLKPLEPRLTAVESLVAICFMVLVCGFWYLQVLRTDYYRVLSEENRIRETVVPAPRGLVLDRENRVLVENRPSFSIVLQRENITDLAQTLENIRHVPFLDVASVLARMNKYKGLPSFMPIVVKEDVGPADVAFVEARRLELPELEVKVEFKRYYRETPATAHIIGYVNEVSEAQLKLATYKSLRPGDFVGQAGIEKRYDSLLRGLDGRAREVVNSRGRKITELDRIEPVPGHNVVLSVDLELMNALRQVMQDKVGSAVVLDVRTGELLAMVSEPAYDPNAFAGHFSHEDWNTVRSDPNRPLQNRAVNNLYSPGSTFKLVVALAALEEGLITPATTFYCPGYATIYGHTFHCWNGGGHGTMDLQHAIVNSCNVYFYQLGKMLGIERIARYARLLGFGSPTGVDLPGEEAGLVPDPAWKMRVQKSEWYAGETISVAIGQGSMLVSPMQMAYHMALVASSGNTFRPHVMRSYMDVEGHYFPYEMREGRRTVPMSADNMEAVRRAMWGVVNMGGTGHRASVAGRDVCGKTGTVQIASNANIKNLRNTDRKLTVHSWFVGFAPLDKPEIAVAVFVEHGGAGGETAAPIARMAFEAYFAIHDRSKTTG